ncbi:MAG: hypothetical protein J6A01_09820 [Proteobacteria bacterium]|nr:hypothetical protein [Pseudomonadota bacterium]
MNEKEKKLDPFMIESFFDGELSSSELDGIREEDIIESETYRALEELRNVVRTDTRMALNQVDGYALWDAISSRIEEKMPAKPRMPESDLSQPKRRTSKQFFQRWAPALIGAGLFLLSIPGFVLWGITMNRSDVQPQTVVVIDSNAAHHDQGVVNYQVPNQQNWNAPNNNAIVMPSNANPVTSSDSQLTVEEMDFAIRHLIQRIESLEDANRSDIESGKKPLLPEGSDQF